MINGMMAIVSIFCVLLAVIGIGNVFSNTLGFVRQRKREFARYMSVGLTPGGMKKIFCVEALVIAGRPMLIVLPVTVAASVLFIKASYINPMLFIREAPFLPILIFILAILGCVAFAYYLGGKKMLKVSLTDALQIRIWDTGTGFAKEDIPHLFERFYRGGQAGKGGVGLGLALSKAIVEQQNGTISAGNLAEGGACYEIRFYSH